MKKEKPYQNQSGFSLIELLIAMSLTLVIASVASTLLAQSFNLRSREDTRSDAIADAQRALNIVSREIANSGFGMTDNGIVAGDTGLNSIRCRANLNAYTIDTATGNPVSGSSTISEADEDIRYSMYDDAAENRHYLVRYDVVQGAPNPRLGTTVLANRIDSFQLQYFDVNGVQLNVATTPALVSNAHKVRISIGVDLPAAGAPGSPGYQPQSTVQLLSDVILRNSSQITY